MVKGLVLGVLLLMAMVVSRSLWPLVVVVAALGLTLFVREAVKAQRAERDSTVPRCTDCAQIVAAGTARCPRCRSINIRAPVLLQSRATHYRRPVVYLASTVLGVSLLGRVAGAFPAWLGDRRGSGRRRGLPARR